MKRLLLITLGALLALVGHPASVLACAACYGQSDSPMAAGINWGIFCLLGFIVFVLGSLSTFFVFLAKRSGTVIDEPLDQDGKKNSESDHGKL